MSRTASAMGARWRQELARDSNEATDGMWEAFAQHRARVTALLLEQHDQVVHPTDLRHPYVPQGTLCILGAGNSNDLDLHRLLRRFDQIALVDVDSAALMRGVARQRSQAVAQRVHLHGDIDLFDIDRLNNYLSEVAIDSKGRSAGAGLERTAVALPGSGRVAAVLRTLLSPSCDVVGATGLLPMLVVALQQHFGFTEMPVGEHAPNGWHEALDALCHSYLDNLAAVVRPGGAVVHVSTLVVRPGAHANDTFSESSVLREHIAQGAFFPATNPYAWLVMDGGGTLHSATLWRGPAGRRKRNALAQNDTEPFVPHALVHARPYWVWRTSLTYGVSWLANAA